MPKSTPSNFLDELLKREYYDKTHLSKKIVNDRLKVAQNLYNKNFLSHYGCVNAIEFLNGGQFLASGGDDRRVLLWNIQEALQGVGSPNAMRAQHVSNIFCIGYDSKNTRLFSAGNDDQVIIHDIHTGDPLDFFLYEQPVYGLSVDPSNDDVFASACDDGRVLIYDIREPSSAEPLVLARCTAAFHGVMYNPAESRLLATANAKEGACLWDVRKPQHPLLTYGSTETPQSSMSVRWNNNGSLLLALRRRLPPVLYQIDSPVPVAQFDHPGYFNSCTMKSCCFAGYDDEYVLSGSDDFNLYMWKIPPLNKAVKGGAWVSNAHVVLGGHRSIVNQVRFNPDNYLIASSGVEKLIKIWSPFPLPLSSGGLEKETVACKKRKVFSHEEYISLVMRSGQIITHDYSQESTKEDPRMMAFFDSLVQREIEGWSSDDSAHTDSVLSPPPLYSDHSLSDSSDKCDDETEEEEEEEDDDNNDNDNENEDQTGGNGGEDDSLVGDQTTSSRRKKNKSNPIVKLIAKKRAQLMRLAKINHTIVTRNSNLNSSSLLSQATTTNDNTTTSNGINFGDSYTNSQTSTSTAATTRSSIRNSISISSTSGSNSSSSCSKSSDNSTSSHSNISNDNDSDINDVSKPIANGKGKKRKRVSKSSKKYKRSNHLLSIAQLYSSDTSSTDNSSDSDEDFYIDLNHSDNNDSNNNDKDCDGHDSIKDKSKKLESSSNKPLKHCFKKRKSSLKFCSNNNYNTEKINTLDKKNESLIKNSLEATTTNEERHDDVDGNRDEIRNKTPINNSSTVINNDLINSSTSNTPDCIPNTPESNAVRTGTEAETQDSGIFLSDNSSIMDIGNKKLISNSKYKHRNYRKRISRKSDSE